MQLRAPPGTRVRHLNNTKNRTTSVTRSDVERRELFRVKPELSGRGLRRIAANRWFAEHDPEGMAFGVPGD